VSYKGYEDASVEPALLANVAFWLTPDQ